MDAVVNLLKRFYPNDEPPEDTNFPRWMPQDGPYGPAIHTSIHRVKLALELANCTLEDVVLDLGCGDGRFCVAAVSLFGVKRAVGVDSDAELIEAAQGLSANCLAEAGQMSVSINQTDSNLTSRVSFVCGDIRDGIEGKSDVGKVIKDTSTTILIAFLTPEFSNECKDLILAHYHRGCRIVAVCFDLANLKELRLKPPCGTSGIDGIWVYDKNDECESNVTEHSPN